MISSKVDLTEHRDFSRASLVSLREQISLMRQERVLDLEDSPFMRMDEYKMLSRYYSIFGTVRHTNEKDRIFEYEKRHTEYWKRRCIRCGRLLGVPWNRHGELCEQCDDVVENSRIPWKSWKQQYSDRDHFKGHDDVRDLFNLR